MQRDWHIYIPKELLNRKQTFTLHIFLACGINFYNTCNIPLQTDRTHMCVYSLDTDIYATQSEEYEDDKLQYRVK